jgi:hypothetical protein
MLDQPDAEDTSDPSPDQLHGTYPPQFDHHQPSTSDYYQPPMSAPLPMTSQPQLQFGHMGEIIDPDDPMLDADPFGLSASMHYPTNYHFGSPAAR